MIEVDIESSRILSDIFDQGAAYKMMQFALHDIDSMLETAGLSFDDLQRQYLVSMSDDEIEQFRLDLRNAVDRQEVLDKFRPGYTP